MTRPNSTGGGAAVPTRKVAKKPGPTKRSTTTAKPANTVEAYLAAAPKNQRAALMKLRETIKAAAPSATESVSYGMAGYKHERKHLLIFGYWKTHVAIYGSFDAHAAELKPYDQSLKGTVRFPADKPLPYGLVTRIVKARVAEIDKGA